MDKKFDIVIGDKVFESDSSGLLNLNDIWKGCELPNNKRPSQWRGKIRDNLQHCENLHSARVSTDNNEHSALFGDEVASVSYAMFVSVDFYRSVVEAFVALRNGEVAKAYKLAQETTNKVADNAFEKWLSYSDTNLRDACGMLGVKRTMLFMSEAKKPAQLKSFLERGILKNRNYGDKGVAIKITPKGKHWIKDNIKLINSKLDDIYNKEHF
jgi:hypothetical protein